MSRDSKKSEVFVHSHQFESPLQQYQASTLGMWLFLVTEIMFFGGLFLAYSIYRGMYPDAFAHASHHLNIELGVFNTVMLISSSLTMALAVRSGEMGSKKGQIWFLLLTVFFGLIFLGVKGIEYSHKFHEHLVPGPHFQTEGEVKGTQLFFSLYFAMTGMHAVHMIIGIAMLLTLTVQAAQGKFTKAYHTPVEMIGLYWHFVDIVWIFLFPLLYLIGRHVS